MKNIASFLSAILLTVTLYPSTGLSESRESPSFQTSASQFKELRKTLPKRLVMDGILLASKDPVGLTLERYNPFSGSASFLVGGSAGEVSRLSLKDMAYYRGFVTGFEDSFAFLSVDKNTGVLRGSIERDGRFWNLRLDKNRQQLIASEAPRSKMNLPLDLGDDFEDPKQTNLLDSKFKSEGVKFDKAVVPRSKLEVVGTSAFGEQNFTEYNCNTSLFEQYPYVGWTLEAGTACVTNFDIPDGYTGRFTVFGQDGNEGNADLYVRRGNPAAVECESTGETVDEVCSDIVSGVVEVVVTAPDTKVSYWLRYEKKNRASGNYEKRCNAPDVNDYRSHDIDAGSACIFEFDIPEDTTGTFTLWGRAENTGDADMLVRRADTAAEVACRSESEGVNEYCDGIESGSVEVVVSAPTDSVKISLDYALAIPALSEGFQYEAVVAVDLDYQIYQDLGSLEVVQNYIAEIFAYTNVPFEQEIQTHLAIGDIRVRQTADDDPYHVDEELSTACRLAELESKWMGSEGLSSVQRSTVAHLTSFPFGGIATTGSLCMDPVTYSSPREVENCPFDNLGTGGFFVSGRQGVVSTIGEGPAFADFVVAHELGHNFNSQHSHGYMGFGGNASPVDACYVEENRSSSYWMGDTALPGVGSLEGGVSGERTGTIMSYCHRLPGGTSGNQSMTFGKGFAYGVEPERVPERMRNFVGALALSTPSCITTVSTKDTDGDGFPDAEDAFPNDPEEWLDTDGDGSGNNTDTDDDNDGFTDDYDVFPLNETEWYDSDGDGLGDNSDEIYNPTSNITFNFLNRTNLCSSPAVLTFQVDGNYSTSLNPGERLRTNLAEGTHAVRVLDESDSELVKRLLEVPYWTSWGWGCEWEGWSLDDFEVIDDSDGDFVADIDDDFPLDRAESTDSDGDGVGNNADTDDDDDGYSDSEEIQAGTDPLRADSFPSEADENASGLPIWLYYIGTQPQAAAGRTP